MCVCRGGLVGWAACDSRQFGAGSVSSLLCIARGSCIAWPRFARFAGKPAPTGASFPWRLRRTCGSGFTREEAGTGITRYHGPMPPTLGASMSHPFDTLTPDLVLDAVESIGFLSDARVLALNSYENRVYQVGIEDAQPLIAKF
ncbi:protein of unknown function, partial [Pseudomonas sp. JV551A1]